MRGRLQNSESSTNDYENLAEPIYVTLFHTEEEANRDQELINRQTILYQEYVLNHNNRARLLNGASNRLSSEIRRNLPIDRFSIYTNASVKNY